MTKSLSDIDECNSSDGNTPLHLACKSLNLPFIHILLRNKADVNAVNVQDELPLKIIQDKRIEYEQLDTDDVKTDFIHLIDMIESVLIQYGGVTNWRDIKR